MKINAHRTNTCEDDSIHFQHSCVVNRINKTKDVFIYHANDNKKSNMAKNDYTSNKKEF